MKRMLKIIGWTLLGCWLFVSLGGPLFYNRLLFFPPPSFYQPGGEYRILKTADGGVLALWQAVNPRAEYTILYSHGNGEDLGEVKYISDLFLEHGFSFVAYDYSGYGLSSGKPTVKNTYRNIDAVYQFLTHTQGLDPSKIIVMGNSIGGGPSTWLAAKEPVGGLFLQSSFTSVYRVVTQVPVFLGSPYPNLARIRKINCPLLVVHGTADKVVPFRQGKQLFARARGPKIFHSMPATGHNEVFLFADDAYWSAVRAFLKKVQEVR